MYSGRADDICREAEGCFGRRGNLLEFWQDTADLHYPERADFTHKKTLGEDFASKLYAGQPALYRRDFGNFLGSALRPKGRKWFDYRCRDQRVDEHSTVRTWLEARTEDTRKLLYDPKSGFVKSSAQADHDWVTFGNAVQSFEEREMGGLRFRTWHLRDCAWEDDFDGETHIFYRRFPTSVRNLVARAMRKNDPWSISPKVTEKLRKEPDVMIKCLHVVMPAQFYYLDKLKPTEPWVSLYLDENHRWEMKVTQRRHFQYCVSRWFTVAGSPYAFSPSVVVSTPDARTLQAMTWSILEAGEKAVEPPLIATHEAVLSGVDIRAGHTTWIDKNYDERMGEAIRVLELGKHPELGEAIRQGVTGTLMEAWYLNRLFLPQFNHQMTAEETARRHEEFLRASQPIIDPAEEERNGKLLDPLAAFLMDRGYWGPPAEMPPELRNRHVDVTYDNPIEDARKQAKTMAFGQVVALTEQAKAIDPTAPAHLDTSKMFRDAVAGVAPPDWLVTEEEAQEAAKELEQQSTEQAGIEQAGQIASIAAEAAKAQPTQ